MILVLHPGLGNRYPQEAFHHLALLLGAAAEEVAAAMPARGTENRERLLLQARIVVARHIDDGALSVTAVAAALRISTRYLQQLWCEVEPSLVQYIASTRLDRVAASLVNAGRVHESVTRIALSHGFTNPSHFARAF